MSVTTSTGARLTRGQSAQMPALLEFYSPSAALLDVKVQPPARGVVWTVCSMFVACAVAAGLIPIDKVVSAAAKVVTVDASSVVQPLETSIVRKIFVVEGQVVHKGDLLAELDPTITGADKTALGLQVASLRAEVERRQAEQADQEYKPSTLDASSQLQLSIFAQRHIERMMKLENYQQKIDGLQATLGRAIGDVKAYSLRLQVAETLEAKRHELAQLGWGSQLNDLQAQDNRLDIQRSLNDAQQQAKTAATDLQAMRAEMSAYDQNWKSQNAQDLQDAQRKLDQSNGDLNKATLRSQLVDLRADVNGVVQSIAPVNTGSVLQSGDQLMRITPSDAPLEVEANVLGSEIGYVHVGEPVTLKIDSLPYVRYGTLQGSVRVISPDSFTGMQAADTVVRGSTDEIGRAKAPAPGQAYYKVRVSIDKSELHNVPLGFKVGPGMPITADLMVGKRTVLSYLFSRAMPVMDDGMREP